MSDRKARPQQGAGVDVRDALPSDRSHIHPEAGKRVRLIQDVR